MEKITLNAYLQFDGNCREAMNFYQSVCGEADLMASDNPDSHPLGTGKISPALSGYYEGKLRKTFEALSAGGKVTMPLEKQVWGDIFGVMTDQFGIDWMVNIGTAKV